MKERPRDLNMQIAIQWGRLMCAWHTVPSSLLPIEKRAKFVLEIEKIFPAGYIPEMPYEDVQRKLSELDELLKKKCKETMDWHEEERIGFCLRLWGGTVIASKAIARGTASGVNTKKIRHILSKYVETEGVKDPIVAAGIDCAPVFKSLRKEPWSLDGISWFNWLMQNNNNLIPRKIK